ncbi:unnamed protein product [Choristocarpus tenellus]
MSMMGAMTATVVVASAWRATAFVTSGWTVGHVHGVRSSFAHSASPTISYAKKTSIAPMMAIRAVETYDGTFDLTEETAAQLNAYLQHPDMLAEVAKQFECEKAEYIGELFQPVPYSSGTPNGMPADIDDRYHLNPEFAIANVPPVIMFKAKVFKPSRLCAVYKISGMSDEARARFDERIARARDDAERRKEDVELSSEWDDLGSVIKDVFRNPQGEVADEDDEDIDLDSMVV